MAGIVGEMTDVDGVRVAFSINLDGTVRISIGPFTQAAGAGMADFDQEKAEEFAQLFVRACWEAGQNARRMAEEAGTP